MDDVVALSRARSMLIVLQATSEQALAALALVAHDTDLDAQLHTLIAQTRTQLEAFETQAS